MRAEPIVIICIDSQGLAKMTLIYDDTEIDALAADRADQLFGISFSVKAIGVLLVCP